MGTELTQLIELQELDLELQRLNDRLVKIPGERDQIESEFRQYAAEFLALKDSYEGTLRDRKQLEADLESAQEHHDKYKQDLMRVTNQKQYETALREIDATKKQIGAFEGEVLKRMEDSERLDAELKDRAPDVDRKREDADRVLAALDDEKNLTEQQIAGLNDRRKLLSAQLPKPLFAAYDRLARSRRGQALAPINNDGICSACRVRVRPKVFSDVRRGGEMIVCENCGRILYYRNDSSAEAAS